MCSPNKTFQERFHRLSLKDGGGIDYDCEFLLGPQHEVVKGHKLIFSAASEVFKVMFYGDFKEEKSVKVEDLDPEGFKGMKQFIYSGEVNFTSANHALFTYASARKYMVPGLGEKCITYLQENLQPSEVLEFFEYCRVFLISDFDYLCTKIIQEKTDEVVESEYFVSCEIGTIELLLKSPCLRLESESKLFVHFERWALAEARRRDISAELMQSSFNNLKRHIRFLTMSLKESFTCIQKSLLLTHEEKNSIIHNLLAGINSEPMPQSLSLEEQHRKFNISPVSLINKQISENYEYKNLLSVRINHLCGHCSEFTMPKFCNLSIRVTCTKTIGLYICFYVEFIKRKTFEVIEILNIKSRLRVLAEERCDDLHFVNDFHVVLDFHNLWKQKMSFAKIPITTLNNETFSRGTFDKVVIIEALFDFEGEREST